MKARLSVQHCVPAAAISAAGSIAAIRLATPASMDERISVLLIWLLLPAVLALLLGRLHRMAGLLFLCAVPFASLALARESGDTPLLWLLPPITAALILGLRVPLRARRAPPIAGGLTLLLALATVLWPLPGAPKDGPKVVLIGLDGATWQCIDPWVSAGKLPNMAQLMAHGRRARLRSLPSLYSPQVWSTIATGCTPEVHGILDFASRQEDLRVGRIWDQLRGEGRSFGICAWYFIWPPRADLTERDFVIPNGIAPDDATFPPDYSFFWKLWANEAQRASLSLLAAARDGFRHGVRLSTLRRAGFDLVARRLQRSRELDQPWRGRVLGAALQTDVFVELIRTRRPEFAATLYIQTDKVSHLYWKYLHPESFRAVPPADCRRWGSVIESMYVEADRCIGQIRRVLTPQADILIVSDHGFQATRPGHIARYCRVRTERLLRELGMTDKVFGTNVDNRVYLRSLGTAGAESDSTALDRLQAVLDGARAEGEPAPFFTLQRDAEALVAEIAPRDSIDGDAVLQLNGRTYRMKELVRIGQEVLFSGAHHPDGIYLLSGPAAEYATGTDSLNVLDVAPTVAGLLHLPASPLWTGRPAVRAPALAFQGIAAYPAPSASSPTPTAIDEALREKLRSLGYLE